MTGVRGVECPATSAAWSFTFFRSMAPPGLLRRLLLRQQALQIREGGLRGCAMLIGGTASGAPRFQLALVLVVVAIQAEQLPVAAVGRIVVVVVVAVMDGALAQVLAREFPGATSADPGIDLQR